MYAEIDNEMIVQTIAAYDKLTDLIHERISNEFHEIYRRMDQKQKDEFILAASMPGGEVAEPVIPKDVFQSYEHYIQLCCEQIKNTYHSIIELMERQETMNRIKLCYNLLPPRDHLILQIFYEESDGYTDGLLSAMSQLDLGRSSILRYRSKAMDKIYELYNSDLSQLLLLEESKRYR